MKKIVIIEDEEIAAGRLIKMVADLIPDASFLGPIDTISAAVEFLSTQPSPDLIFLDIQLADGLSFEIFRQVQVSSPVIFTTAFDEFAIRAFELNSIDYLLKPIEKPKLKASIEKFQTVSEYYQSGRDKTLQEVIKNILPASPGFKRRFLVSRGDVLLPLGIEEIVCFMAEDKMVMLYTRDGKKYLVNYTLDALENQLDPADFFRINRFCIIHSQAIVKVHSFFNYKLKVELHPHVSDDLVVSRSRSMAFKTWLGY
jgi:DNA-binding LytR/AlgR family response regulator